MEAQFLKRLTEKPDLAADDDKDAVWARITNQVFQGYVVTKGVRAADLEKLSASTSINSIKESIKIWNGQLMHVASQDVKVARAASKCVAPRFVVYCLC